MYSNTYILLFLIKLTITTTKYVVLKANIIFPTVQKHKVALTQCLNTKNNNNNNKSSNN